MPVLPQRYDPAVDVSTLVHWPDNARRGDRARIRESIEVNGFAGAVLVQESTRRIISGNHRLDEALAVGDDALPVLFIDCDDETAERLNVALNGTEDHAGWELSVLTAQLARLAESPRGLDGSGFTKDELDDMLFQLTPPSLDDLASKYNVPPADELERKFWPRVIVQVHPTIYGAWNEAVAESGGDGAVLLAKLLGVSVP